MDMGAEWRRPIRWLLVVLALSAAARLLLALPTVPRIAPDSLGYLAFAHQLGHLDVSANNGARTPLYSLLLLALHYHVDVVCAVQMVLGLAITGVLFWTIWRLTGRVWAAVLGSLVYGLGLTPIMEESAVLTETFTTFLLVALAATLTWLWIDRDRHVTVRLVVAGLCAGLVPLLRPQYEFVPFLVVVVAFLWVSRLWRRRLALGLLLVAAFVPMLAWSTLNYAKFDTFALSTMTGFDLTNKTGDYIKDAPAKYATIRDIYVNALESRASEHRGPVDLIFGLIPAMEAATGQSYPQLSKTILHMDEYLIIHHQEQYWGNVATVFRQFWSIDSDPLRSLPHGSHVLVTPYRWFGRLVNLAFALICIVWVVKAVTRRRWPEITPVVWMAATAVLSAVFCALVIDGSNARFGMPTQPFVVCVVLVAVCSRYRSIQPVRSLRSRKALRDSMQVSTTTGR